VFARPGGKTVAAAWALPFFCMVLRTWGATTNYKIEVWQTDQGLPHSSVTTIAQTADGYLWLGTQNGLARFDGVAFTVYDENNTPAIKNSRIVRLFEDRDHALWIGTEQGGLVQLQGGKFAAYVMPGKGTTHNYARMICEDDAASLWVVSCEWQVLRMTQGKCSVVSSNWNLAGQRASAVAQDESGRVWIGTERELATWQKGKLQLAWSQGDEPNFTVEFLAPRRAGGCWVAANGRIREFAPAELPSDFAPYAWTNRLIYDLYEDRQKNLWVATMGSGLFRYDPSGNVLHLTTRQGLPTDYVRCVTEDKEGNIWVGTEGGGLCRLKPAVFRTLDMRDGLASAQVMAVSEPHEGGLWIGSNGDGLDRWQHGKVTHYGMEQGLKNGHVWSVLQDRQGAVWVGTWEGLFKGDANGFVGASDGRTIRWQVLALFEDSRGDLWVGQQAFDGITRVRGDERTVIRIPGASANMDVRAMVEDREGNFWIGTNEEGLYRMANGEFTRFGRKDGLGSEAIWCLYVDAEGVLWVGTCRGGLSRWQNGQFTTWMTRDGLVNNVICQILEDGRGNLWLGSYGGVFKVSRAELNRSAVRGGRIQCVRYGKESGLPSIECQGGFQPSGCKTRDGRLWFPTVKGLAVLDPEAVTANPLPPPVMIEQALLDGVAQPELDRFASGSPAALVVPPGRQRLDFRYTAPSLTAPEAVKFKYRMEGLESEWVEAGARRTANYSHVPSGDYRFHVIACNNDGVWNEEGAMLAVVVRPHFWQTRWFLAVASLVALAAAATGARYLEARRLQRRLELAERERAIERERSRIAKDMHDDLGAHLTEIALLSEFAQHPEAPPEQVQADVRKITGRARALTRSLDEIVWAVNPQNDTLENFVSYSCSFAEEYLRLARIACRLEVPEQIASVSLATDVRHNLYLVLKEALNNVVKHAGASKVWIQMAHEPGLLRLTIRDNGKGLPAAVSANGVEVPAGGVGRNGLANMRKRTESIGGQFEMRSQPNQGTSVILSIRMGI
jgi:ligand-binding sensor domain-containing protein/signal transduction histidine kinase